MSIANIASVITAKNLIKYFENMQAVKGINFTIKKQEIVGILGPNGAGKTTTIRLLTGVYQLDPESSIKIIGYDLKKQPLVCKSQFGIVPETSNAFLDFTVRQNIMFSGKINGLKKAEINNRMDILLKEFNLEDKRNAITKTLSKGLKQRLNFCMALIHDPQILLLDEPTSGLDPISVRLLRDKILSLRNSGKTILLTTHDMAEAQKICDRVLIINHGKIIIDESPESLRKKFGPTKNLLFHIDSDLAESAQNLLMGQLTLGSSLKHLPSGYFQVSSDNTLQDIAAIQKFFQEKGIPITDLKLEEITLEEIFIQIIQKEEKSNE